MLLAGTGAHGHAVENDLIAAGMPIELADRDTVIPIITLADDDAAVARFTETLVAAVERHRGAPAGRSLARVDGDAAGGAPPAEAFFAPNETVAADHAVGRISAELVAPYPPGVPVLAPGEIITAEALAALRAAHADGGRIAYAADLSLATLQVIAAVP